MKPLQPTLLCLYRYDALDRLIGHTPLDEPPLQRFYCKSRLTTEVQGVIKHSIVQQSDLLLAQQRVDDDALETSLMATDQQRSVMHLLKTDHPPQPLAYSPYGHRPRDNGMLSLLGFNGERPDSVTGHYLLGNGYRAFNPVLMRFNSPDSLSPFGKGGLNTYAYCMGNPVHANDPTGHVRILPNILLDNIRWAKIKVTNWQAAAPRKDFVIAKKIARAERKKIKLNESHRIENWENQVAFENTRLIELAGDTPANVNVARLSEMTTLNSEGKIVDVKSGPYQSPLTGGQREMMNGILNRPHPKSQELETRIRQLLGNQILPETYDLNAVSRIRKETFRTLSHRQSSTDLLTF